MPTFDLQKLKKLHSKAKDVDDSLFSEQRTNILLKSGNHYNKKRGGLYENLRTKGFISKDQKIRLVKNHIHKITGIYENSILETNPSVTAVPYNEDELHDVKAAEINQSVIDWIKHTNDWDRKRSKFVDDFTVIGEVFGILRFDYSKGKEVISAEGTKSRLGEIAIDRVLAFDMKRDPNARDQDDVRWWIKESMVDIKEFKIMVADIDSEFDLGQIAASSKGTYKVFDNNTGEYRDEKDQVFVKELFYKPSIAYPKGYYVMFTDEYIVTESELPHGIYPIITEGFDEMTTSPRSSSIIRVCRPYQVEINRASSKMAEHQITLGDDKVYIQKGTKIANGGYVHGVRAIQVSGQTPTIQAGRSGAHYLEYQLSQIKEMYEACNLDFIVADKQPMGDPYQLLFRSMKEKKKFVKYVSKYERFETKLFEVALEIAKRFLTPEHVIRIAGRNETVNIPEYRSMKDDGFEIKIVPQSGDVETKFGKMLSITQTLQYAGSSLDPEQLGMLIKELPIGNKKQVFSPLTMDTDNAINDILAMDRGEQIPVNPYDNHEFMIKAISNRMKQSDFRYLEDGVKELYLDKISQHEQIVLQNKKMIEMSQAGMIPTGGFLTTVNASWHNPAANRIERIKVPSDAIKWLMEKLEQQGLYAQQAANLPPKAQADIAAQDVIQAQQQQEQESQRIIPGLEGPQANDKVPQAQT